MIEREIRSLLRKYIEEKISPEEKERFLNLLSSPEHENSFKEIFFSLLDDIDEKDFKIHKRAFDKIYNEIISKINLTGISHKEENTSFYRSRAGRMIVRSIGIAATLAITFFLGGLFNRIATSDTGKKASVAAFTEIKSPYGSTSEINLPDGSQVLLNAGSSIKYQNDFNITNRDLFLTGEAYFRVSKNIDLPLNVSAGNLNIRAVGTQFNIKAYGDEPVIETTLVEGKVELTQLGPNDNKNKFIDLNPNQKAIFIKVTGSFTLEQAKKMDSTVTIPPKTLINNILISPKVDVSQVAAWTQGKLVIKGEYLEDLCIKLQRKYDVTFIFGDEELRQFRFTGILLDETLDQVLNAVKLTAPIEYTISGKSVYMNTDKKSLNNFSKHLK